MIVRYIHSIFTFTFTFKLACMLLPPHHRDVSSMYVVCITLANYTIHSFIDWLIDRVLGAKKNKKSEPMLMRRATASVWFRTQVFLVYLQYISAKIHSKCASQPKVANKKSTFNAKNFVCTLSWTISCDVDAVHSILKCVRQPQIAKKKLLKPLFWVSTWFKVIDVGTTGKLVGSACYDAQLVCVYLQPFSS